MEESWCCRTSCCFCCCTDQWVLLFYIIRSYALVVPTENFSVNGEFSFNGYKWQPVTVAAVHKFLYLLLFLGPRTDTSIELVSCPPYMTSDNGFRLWLPVLTSGLTSGYDQYQFWFWLPVMTSGMTSSTTSGYGKGPGDHVRHRSERFHLYLNQLSDRNSLWNTAVHWGPFIP